MTTPSLPLDHSGLGVMPAAECLYWLGTARVGRVAFMSDGCPIILPVNHGVDGHSIVFRANDGTKQAAAGDGQAMAFEVDAFDVDRRAGWSVVVRGQAAIVDDAAEIERLDGLGVWPWADAARRTRWVRIRPEEITGRKVNSNLHADHEE